MEELTGYGLKNSLILPSLGNSDFNKFRDANYETINTYNVPYMRNFVEQSIKGGRRAASNQ